MNLSFPPVAKHILVSQFWMRLMMASLFLMEQNGYVAVNDEMSYCAYVFSSLYLVPHLMKSCHVCDFQIAFSSFCCVCTALLLSSSDTSFA